MQGSDKVISLRKFDPTKLKQDFQHIQWKYQGRVSDIVGTVIEAVLPSARLGTVVEIEIPHRQLNVAAEVVGFRGEHALLIPFENVMGISAGCPVTVVDHSTEIPVGEYLLGHTIDPFLKTLGNQSLTIPENTAYGALDCPPPDPLRRSRISSTLSLGVRAIDGLLTFGRGQRIGIMAGSGVGKSVLMGMLATNSDADINVIALIGERGREVREFIERDLGEEALQRSVVIAVTSDKSPLLKIRGAKVATTIAEHFSQQGANVLLMADSLTRIAMAQREVGNAIGEPPTTKGYTPSVFSLLPKLLERAGPGIQGNGSISAFYTVLVDGDDFNDPIADAARSILDGHINLTRELASRGHFPAIDITTSSSRAMKDIAHPSHIEDALRIRELLAVYQDNLDLIQIGAYKQGQNQKLDIAIRLMPLIEKLLRQKVQERTPLTETAILMSAVLAGKDFSLQGAVNS